MRIDKSDPIGLFDSGLGGLTVAHAIQKVLPFEKMVYFGDTFHLPYGDKSQESIRYYSEKITEFLLQKKCKVILIACNTASANAYKEVCEFVEGKAVVMNVIDPVVSYIVSHQDQSPVGVIGTKGTVMSNSYAEKIHARSPETIVRSLATPLFVPMIEEGFVNDSISDAIIEAYLSREQLDGIRTLILGCTHYPIIRNQITDYYRGEVDVLDTASIVAIELQKVLQMQGLLSDEKESQSFDYQFLVSDYTDNFRRIAEFFFKQKLNLQLSNFWK